MFILTQWYQLFYLFESNNSKRKARKLKKVKLKKIEKIICSNMIIPLLDYWVFDKMFHISWSKHPITDFKSKLTTFPM